MKSKGQGDRLFYYSTCNKIAIHFDCNKRNVMLRCKSFSFFNFFILPFMLMFMLASAQLSCALKFQQLDQVLSEHKVETALLTSQHPTVAQLSVIPRRDALAIVHIYFTLLYSSLPLCLMLEVSLLHMAGFSRPSLFIVWPGLALLHLSTWVFVSHCQRMCRGFQLVKKSVVSALPSAYREILKFYPSSFHVRDSEYHFSAHVVHQLFGSCRFVLGTMPISFLLAWVYVYLF